MTALMMAQTRKKVVTRQAGVLELSLTWNWHHYKPRKAVIRANDARRQMSSHPAFVFQRRTPPQY